MLSNGRIFNFSPGPAMLPDPVMARIKDEFMNYGGLGASVIEISHRSKDFEAIVNSATSLFRELTSLPENYSVLFVAGGGRMQFSAVPMNLIGRVPSRKALYVETGTFAANAIKDAAPYGEIKVIATSRPCGFVRIPDVTPQMVDQDAAYLHITTNNTVWGTRWNTFPETGDVPLVGDSTSEICSRVVNFSRFGIVYAGLQKNLGPSGTAIVIVRKDLLGKALSETPILLNYASVDKANSLVNTPSTFNIYVVKLVLEWLKEQGGIPGIEKRNNEKAALLYGCLDASKFYKPIVDAAHRSTMNVTFHLPSQELLDLFLKGIKSAGLYALKGYREVGGIRASIYNAMPLEGVQALVSYMREFERTNG